MTTKKKTTVVEGGTTPEESKVEVAPKEVKKETAPKRLTLKDLKKLETSAEKLILKEDFKKVSELSDAPGLLISGFRGVDGVLRLRLKYKVDEEVIIDKLKTIHHL